jgi:hypothetical protein
MPSEKFTPKFQPGIVEPDETVRSGTGVFSGSLGQVNIESRTPEIVMLGQLA